MSRSCRNRFRCFLQMKITKLELFQNVLKIIMVGTGNVLSPHKYFQFERTLKNVVVNSESAFWDILWWVTFWDISIRLLEGLGGQACSSWGPPKGVGRPHVWGSMELHFLPIMPFMCDICMGILGFSEPSLPLGFPINRGGVGIPNFIPFSHKHAMHYLASSLPPTKRVS